MRNTSTKGLFFNSEYEEYFYTGYIIRPNYSGVTLIHLALVNIETKRTEALQSALIFDSEGTIFGTIKKSRVMNGVVKEYWNLFKTLVKQHTNADMLFGEVPEHLAEHYLKTYDGVVRSDRIPCTPLPGIITVEVPIERNHVV